ncbi:MAG: MotA/TolQ/ExbB proton channel family protein [Thiolinea sp.]
MATTDGADTPWLITLQWLWLAGLILFGVYWAWDTQLLQQMIRSDRTWISLLILIAFLAGSLHCAWRSHYLSRQSRVLQHWRDQALPPPQQTDMARFLNKLEHSSDAYERQTTAELLGEQLRGSHQSGWFLTATLIKLGLLGTVIGFVLMLASIGQLESLDIDQVQSLMQQMTQGMGIALNTTLMGLVGSILLGIQYLFLDRSADKLLARSLQLTQGIHTPSHPDVL